MLCVHCETASPSSGPPCPNCGKNAWLDGRYRLESILAESARAVVYRGTDRENRKPVCIKAYRKDSIGDVRKAEALLHRMTTEESVLKQLDVPRIPKLIDVFDSRAGSARKYLVLTLMEGPTLRQVMDARRWTEAEVSVVLDEIATLVEPLHALSPPVVHRDLSLDNLVVVGDARSELLEGRVEITEVVPNGLALVGFGHVHATLGHELRWDDHPGPRPPEAYEGKVSAKSDVYRLGLLGLELLSRQNPQLLLGPNRTESWQQALALSEPFQASLSMLLSEDPNQRPSMEAFLGRTEAPGPSLGLEPTSRTPQSLEPASPNTRALTVPRPRTSRLPWTRQWAAVLTPTRQAPSRALAKRMFAERSVNPRLHRGIDDMVSARLAASYEVSAAAARDLLEDLSWDQEVKLFEDAFMSPSTEQVRELLTEWQFHEAAIEDGAPLQTGAFVLYWLDVRLLDRLRPQGLRRQRKAARLAAEAERAQAAFLEFSRSFPEARTMPPHAVEKASLGSG